MERDRPSRYRPGKRGARERSRRTLRRALPLLPGLLLAAAGCGREPALSPPRIVLVYLVDTVRPDHLQVYGYDRETTPRLAEFADDAVLFESAYSPSPWTKPSVASLLTSLYPMEHGALEKRDRLAADLPTAAEAFRDAGYETAAFSSSPWIIPTFGFDRGFDTFEVVTRGGAIQSTRIEEVYAAFLKFWKGRDRSKPLFVYLHSKDPHGPYSPPDEYIARIDPGYRGRSVGGYKDGELTPDRESAVLLYDAEILYNDDYFGRLVDMLKEEGLYDETMIVYLADHGEEFLDHGDVGHGKRLWEEQVRVPLLIRFPGGRWGGERVEAPISTIDVLPTLLDACGAGGEAPGAGRSVIAMLEGGGRDGDGEIYMDESRDALELFALRSGPYKAIYETRPEQSFRLYDLRNDPLEKRDIAGDRRETGEEMKREITSRFAGAGTGFWLVVMGDDEVRDLSGTIRTKGAFRGVEHHNLGVLDSMSVADAEISFHFHLTRPQEGVAASFVALRPRRSIRFAADPPDAEIVLDFRLDGERLDAGRLFLGGGKIPAGKLPLTVSAAGKEVRMTRAEFPSRMIHRDFPVEITIGYIPPPDTTAINPELRRELKAMGYLN